MRLPQLDLRLRIAVALAAICIAVVGALGFTLYTASEELEDELVKQLVDEELHTFIERTRTVSGYVAPSGANFEFYVAADPEDLSKLPPLLRGLGPGYHEVGQDADERHVSVRDVQGTRYMAAYDAGPHELREVRFRQLLYMALGTIALLALPLGYWLAGVLTRQLTDLAERVATLHPEARNPRLRRPDQDREVSALAHALDDYQARIIEMIQREQEFTANASHELRTPLTTIRTSCELMLAEASLPDKARGRLEQIDAAARQMTDRIEVLLLLARRFEQAELEAVPLRGCVEDAARPYLDEIAHKGLAFEVAIPQSERVHVDRKALQVVLANLIKNAVRYTDRGYVRVSYDAQRVIVSDSGAGIAPEHQPQLFDRYFRADHRPEGLGLGLAIVRRICEHFGWRIEVKSAPGTGSIFSVQLPP
jgi:signal transduction histidine kinase